MKADGLLARNWLKGAEGDALDALLYGAGHNLRMVLRHLRVLYCALIARSLHRLIDTLGEIFGWSTPNSIALTPQR